LTSLPTTIPSCRSSVLIRGIGLENLYLTQLRNWLARVQIKSGPPHSKRLPQL